MVRERVLPPGVEQAEGPHHGQKRLHGRGVHPAEHPGRSREKGPCIAYINRVPTTLRGPSAV
jgi:hypothetical protein